MKGEAQIRIEAILSGVAETTELANEAPEYHENPPPKPFVMIREAAPSALRDLVIQLAYDAGLRPAASLEILCKNILGIPKLGTAGQFADIDREVRNLIRQAAWWHVYDFVEMVCDTIKQAEGSSGAGTTRETFKGLTQQLNDALRQNNLGWQLVDGKVQIRGPEFFEEAVQKALTVLSHMGHPSACSEIQQAIADLSQRPDPDLAGAIHHASVALDVVARDVTGGSATSIVDSFVEYAKDGEIKEALFVVCFAAFVSTWLVEKGDPFA